MTDNRHIKASFIKFGDKKIDLKGKKCILPISVGQPYHEGKKFEATLDLVNKTFSECVILVCDTLQRYSTAILEKKSPEQIMDFSKHEGIKWVKRNKRYVDKLKIPYELSTWDEWLNHSKFKEYFHNINKLYNSNKDYADILDKNVRDYVERLKSREENIDLIIATQYSLMYLKEECAAMSLCFIENHCDFLLYLNLIEPVDKTLKVLEDVKRNGSIMLGIRFKKHKINQHADNYSLHNIINNMPGHVYWKDRDGKFLGCNLKQAISYGAKNLEGIINKTDVDLIGEELGSIIRENDLSIMKIGKAQIVEEDILVNNKRITVISHKSPFLDDQGNIVGIFGISIDISEQKHKEEKLAYQNKLNAITLESIIAKMPGHVYWKNKEGVYLGCNDKQACSLGMKSGKQVIGKTDRELPWGDYESEKIIEHDETVISNDNAKTVEESVKINNKDFIFLSHKSPLKDHEGSIIGILGVSIDITYQKKLEKDLIEYTQKLQKALEVKERFLRNISHEVRIPLHGILNLSSIVNDQWEKLSELQRKDLVAQLATSSKRLMRLVSNLLDISKMTENKLKITKEEHDLTLITREVIDEFFITLQDKKISVVLDTSKNVLIKCTCDKERISQVIRNFISNAIKYGNNNPISIEINKEESNFIRISVTDQGVGIPDNELESIFEPFEESSRTKTSAGGTGLGLSICKEIIEAHGGKILARNHKKGAVFSFLLPATNQKDKPKEKQQKAEKHNSSKKLTVLVIDDEEIVLISTQFNLEFLGYKALCAQGGAEALRLLRTETPDVILLDLMMPGMNGDEVLKHIKESDHLKSVPVIAQTGFSQAKELDAMHELGINGILKKPYDRNDLQLELSKIAKEF